MNNPSAHSNTSTTLSDVVATLTRLGCQPTSSSTGYSAYCPVHETDGNRHTKSLTLREGDRVPVIVHCHAGCESKTILQAVGIEAPSRRTVNIPTGYSYRDADGHEVRQKLRYEPKEFRICHKEAGRHIYKYGPGPHVLYRLPEVVAAIQSRNTIFLVEGEKDVDRAVLERLTATTNIEGAAQPGQNSKWRREYTVQLSGATCIVLLPDNDPAGRAHMAHIAQQLIGRVQEIVVVDLGKLYPDLPEKGDLSDWLNMGHTVEELLERVGKASPLRQHEPPHTPAPPESEITEPDKPCFVWVQDFCALPPKQSWLIKGYLEPDTLCVLFGDSQSYKSFLGVDLACHIATGQDWRGQKVQQSGIALYIAGEGGNGLRKRFRAWFEYHNEPMRNVAISIVPRALCDPANVAELVATIERFLKGMPMKPSIIELDTLNTHFGDGDENNTADMRKFLNGIRQLRIATGATILVHHHVGHADKSRSRGSISLHQGVDWEYRLERIPESQTTTLTCTKPKDAETPPVLSWTLKQVDLPWADEDGQPLNSAVLIPNDSGPVTKPVKEKMGNQQRRALDVLQELYRQGRQNLEDAGHDPDTARVTLKDWHNAMQGIENDSSNRSKIRKALEERGHVRTENQYVYLGASGGTVR